MTRQAAPRPRAELLCTSLGQLLRESPFLRDFFEAHGLALPSAECSFERFATSLPRAFVEETGLDGKALTEAFLAFWQQMVELLDDERSLASLEIQGGHDKEGRAEELTLVLRPGDVLSIVGPTGAGKSRLLEDVECLAQGDTPTGRRVLVDGRSVEEEQRFSVDRHLVAQLSQNMSFILDVSVEEFLALHAESRMLANVDEVVRSVYDTALGLAGEAFSRTTSVTALSGGQSRALMIADTACLSRSPIVLIDELENAGVDRRRAMELLVGRDKIVLLVTHDPELALHASRRLLIRGGGMRKLVERNADEEAVLEELRGYSRRLEALRREMRSGQRLSSGRADSLET